MTQVSVADFQLKKLNNEDIIFFKIELTSQISEKNWVVYRRFSEFHDLYLVLEKFFINIPKFPNKTLMKLKNFQEITQRRTELDRFINVINYRV